MQAPFHDENAHRGADHVAPDADEDAGEDEAGPSRADGHGGGAGRAAKVGVDGDDEFLEPSGFGFAVAVHPDDADTAWVVPAKKDELRYPVDGRFLVNRTRDGGETFEPLTVGLPDPPAYDLVYRHAFELDESGQILAMGSTTGSLWVREDQGDRWELLTSHLPPVYCVRFG